MATTTAAAPAPASVELARIPLSDISVEDGFNPRGEVAHDDELQALAATIKTHGCLLPIRVRRQADSYVLVAGERRYRAAILAGLEEIPATVLPEHAAEESAERLTEALIENELRADLDPVHRAQAYKALLDQGLTVRGVAERLGGTTGRRSREQRIKEHLSILGLPDDLQGKIGAGEIPVLAVKALVQLSEIHPDLARAALVAVEPSNEYEEPYTWADIAAAPLNSVIGCCDPLPDGIYSTRESYPLERFTLTDQAKQDLAVLAEHGRAPEGIRLAGDLVERASALGAVHDAGWSQIIAGQDVADTLAADWLGAARKRLDEQPTPAPAAGGDVGETDADAAERLREDAARVRQHEREKRDAAVAYNLALGVLAFKHLARLKVDERVVRILASVDLGAWVRGVAARGARLCAPGWVQQAQQKNGRTKTTYVDTHDVREKATEFLVGATGTGEIAGRAITLIALAAYADEQAVAASNRSFYELSFTGAWADEAAKDLVDLVSERIKPGELPGLDERLGRTAGAEVSEGGR